METWIKKFGLRNLEFEQNAHDFKDLDSLPIALYITNCEGKIVYYNQAATTMWGRAPDLDKDRWCGSYDIYNTNGDFLPRHECPMAIAIKENRAIRGVEAIARRPDGTSFRFMPFPTPLHDDNGTMVGAINMLVYLGEAAILLNKTWVGFKATG